MYHSNLPHGVKVGNTIRITKLDDLYDYSYVGREGVVEYIDSMNQLHGTWGGCPIEFQPISIVLGQDSRFL